MKVFLAGATGAIGRRLVPLLLRSGHEVIGTTRKADKAAALRAAGATPVVLDVYDAEAVSKALAAAAPDVLVHQLTDLPQSLDPAALKAALASNARLRRDGTRNLMSAARAAGVRRAVAQSIAFAYAPGPKPYAEADPLDLAGDDSRRVTAEGVAALEAAVTKTPGIAGLVLRYGMLYGPGTWSETPAAPGALHVDAAAQAAVLAVERGAPGIYNVAEDDGTLTIDKARRELGFDASFRIR